MIRLSDHGLPKWTSKLMMPLFERTINVNAVAIVNCIGLDYAVLVAPLGASIIPFLRISPSRLEGFFEETKSLLTYRHLIQPLQLPSTYCTWLHRTLHTHSKNNVLKYRGDGTGSTGDFWTDVRKGHQSYGKKKATHNLVLYSSNNSPERGTHERTATLCMA